MRKLSVGAFMTLDGVVQAPGGPDEDPSGGFKHGGWSVGYWDQMMGNTMSAIMGLPFELLLGKRTYDIFAGYWPHTKSDPTVAIPFNSTRKYVVSHTRTELTWKNSSLITGDVVAQIRKLKEEDGPDLWVHGSGNLIQTLLENNLIDQMLLWIFPVTVGIAGKRLFAEGTQASGLKLVDSKVSTTGVIIATYEPAGALKTGSFAD